MRGRAEASAMARGDASGSIGARVGADPVGATGAGAQGTSPVKQEAQGAGQQWRTGRK